LGKRNQNYLVLVQQYSQSSFLTRSKRGELNNALEENVDMSSLAAFSHIGTALLGNAPTSLLPSVALSTVTRPSSFAATPVVKIPPTTIVTKRSDVGVTSLPLSDSVWGQHQSAQSLSVSPLGTATKEAPTITGLNDADGSIHATVIEPIPRGRLCVTGGYRVLCQKIRTQQNDVEAEGVDGSSNHAGSDNQQSQEQAGGAIFDPRILTVILVKIRRLCKCLEEADFCFHCYEDAKRYYKKLKVAEGLEAVRAARERESWNQDVPRESPLETITAHLV
jgi:hypothetical protein